jgi:putative ABC transport system permease protein
VRTLRTKLVRDVWRLRYQALTIALLVGCGIASLVAATAALTSVEASRDAFYAQARFGHVFVHLQRAPRSVLDRLRALPGVAAVEGRVTGDYRLELPGQSEPVNARFVSLAWPDDGRLDRPRVLAGRDVEQGRADEIVVSDAFAEAWQLVPGDAIGAVIEGRRASLRVVGVAVSPEFVYAPSPRTGLPDPRHFGVIWMDGDALAQAAGMKGAFDDAVLELATGADPADVIDRVDAVLAPYGGLGAVGRGDQPSARLVEQKIGQLARLARTLPVLFLAVAAFLLNVLLSRIVGTQREQIATMKALGYTTGELTRHFLGFSIVICAVGAVLGFGLGVLGAKSILTVYARYFKFGTYLFRIDGGAVIGGAAVALAAGVAGTYLAVRRAVSIPPAEAMRPEPPAAYHATRLDRVFELLPPVARMVVRDLARRPGRLLLSSASIALATAIVLTGASFGDSLDRLLRLQYEISHREDVSVAFDHARPWRAIRDLARVPGVTAVEGERLVPVRLRAGTIAKTTVILGVRPASDLHRLLDASRRPMQLPPDGLALSRTLADELGVRGGDVLDVEVLELGRRKLRVPVTALVDDLLGLQGYMDARALARELDEDPHANVALLAVDRRDVDEVRRRLDAMPAVAAVTEPAVDRELLRSEVGDVYVVLVVVLSVFAAAIAVGVIYNNARIALEVRSRDLATLRILGFTRGELAAILLGEQGVQVALGLGPGLWLGRAIGKLALGSIDRDLMRIPAEVRPASMVAAVCVVLLAAMASALVVRRRADRLDLVAVLKARD